MVSFISSLGTLLEGLTQMKRTESFVGTGLMIQKVLVTKALEQHLPSPQLLTGSVPLDPTLYSTRPVLRLPPRHLFSHQIANRMPLLEPFPQAVIKVLV